MRALVKILWLVSNYIYFTSSCNFSVTLFFTEYFGDKGERDPKNVDENDRKFFLFFPFFIPRKARKVEPCRSYSNGVVQIFYLLFYYLFINSHLFDYPKRIKGF